LPTPKRYLSLPGLAGVSISPPFPGRGCGEYIMISNIFVLKDRYKKARMIAVDNATIRVQTPFV
jgi:hypothetical protein